MFLLFFRAFIHKMRREKRLTNTALKGLLGPNIENLDLGWTYITEGSLKIVMRQCPNLKQLSLRECGYLMTDQLVQQLVKVRKILWPFRRFYSPRGVLTLTWYTYMCLPFGALFHEIWYSDRGVSSEMKEPKLHKLDVFGANYCKKHPICSKLGAFLSKVVYWWVGN